MEYKSPGEIVTATHLVKHVSRLYGFEYRCRCLIYHVHIVRGNSQKTHNIGFGTVRDGDDGPGPACPDGDERAHRPEPPVIVKFRKAPQRHIVDRHNGWTGRPPGRDVIGKMAEVDVGARKLQRQYRLHPEGLVEPEGAAGSLPGG